MTVDHMKQITKSRITVTGTRCAGHISHDEEPSRRQLTTGCCGDDFLKVAYANM